MTQARALMYEPKEMGDGACPMTGPRHDLKGESNGSVGTSHEKCFLPLKGPRGPSVFVTL